MKSIRQCRWLCAALALVFVLSMAGCGKKPQQNPQPQLPEELPAVEVPSKIFINPLPYPLVEKAGNIPQRTVNVKEKHAINSDTVGWLKVDDTVIDDVIVWYPGDNNAYYLRRDFDKKPSWYGIYYADFRSKFGHSWKDLSKNTVIYGHSMNDNPDGRIFSQLKKYLNEDFAKQHPYIFFSTQEEDLVYEVFSVFYSTVQLPYNTPDPSDADFKSLLGEVRARSLYNYDVQVGEQDKVLTLSTCCYNFTSTYPNDYRYVIMAKLVHDRPLKTEAVFTKNPTPKAP